MNIHNNPMVMKTMTVLSAVALLGSMAACGSSSSQVDSKSAAATSAKDFGGMESLVKAAKSEGQLTLIACPDDWANWGSIIKGFTTKYGIKVNSTNPNASSAEEIKAAKNLKGQKNAPDVFDLGATVATTSTSYYAPYKVSSWEKIPDTNKEKTGLYVNDYTGVISIGYDSSKVPKPSSLDDLLGSAYKGKVAINGNPTQAGAAFAAVGWANLQQGGTMDDYSKGIDFFQQLNKAGNFLAVDATSATIASGETPVVIDWNYLNVAAAQQNANFKTIVLPNKAYGSYYNQAINKDAPHPAAARLWEEYVYSAEVQNQFLKSGALPVMAKSMTEEKTIDSAALKKAGGLPEDINLATNAQTDAANALLAKEWSKITS
ncbi:ABC transporter substrate-binding protein [Bifidobacterium sp.]|jgi:putative spermidine/putrescine transport system substrate-binding protein|uniref:ABC transporter substrate-binding protein n=1 Tax=Bifidobacterium sp. TaxID=41200 RepID=UPI0025BA42F7|nr:ABC transporter substrate-binding protein [Bifidobacterium sp.]MCI1635336.1 ABC transporter substrate-binding protein [Bifidobacterium sp.]